nr:DUF3575 domain-containing protein [uncultured Prevotella sp.]
MKPTVKIFILSFFLALNLPLKGAVTPDSYVVILEKDTAFTVTDSLFYAISQKIVFPVNTYTIPRQNALRTELEQKLKDYLPNKGYGLEKIMVRGTASPEGSIRYNQALAGKRAGAMLSLLEKCFDLSEEHETQKTIVAEDYLYLLMLMKQKNDCDYQRVEQIINRYINRNLRQLKAELKKLDGQRVWKRLADTYFKEMRMAAVVLFYRKNSVESKIAPIDLSAILPYPNAIPEEPHSRKRVDNNKRIPRREWLSIKTNLLLDFAYMPNYDRFCPIPNIAIEYYPLHGHFTYGASFDCPWWQDYDRHKYFQVRNYQLETRYYFRNGDVEKNGHGRGMAYKGLYLQGYAHLGLYCISFDKNRGWIGEGAGVGMGIGYVQPLGKQSRWRLEFGMQFGVIYTKYDPFQYESPIYPDLHDNLYYYKWRQWGNFFKKRQHRFTWMGPTRVGMTLTYDLLYRRRAKKGVSMKRWEMAR